MLFMVIERFLDAERIAERFHRQGRMMPEDVEYVASWIETEGPRCFQLMEAPSRDSLDPWMARWSDIMDFEVTPVLTSADFWARRT